MTINKFLPPNFISGSQFQKERREIETAYKNEEIDKTQYEQELKEIFEEMERYK